VMEPRRGNPDRQTEQAGRGLILLSPNRLPLMTAERKMAIQHAIDVMAKGLSWGGALQRFRREEMHER
jgi:hypothetical protein